MTDKILERLIENAERIIGKNKETLSQYEGEIVVDPRIALELTISKNVIFDLERTIRTFSRPRNNVKSGEQYIFEFEGMNNAYIADIISLAGKNLSNMNEFEKLNREAKFKSNLMLIEFFDLLIMYAQRKEFHAQ